MSDIEKVLENIKQYYGLKTFAELADKLGVAQNTLNGWRTRKSFSAMLDKVVHLSQKENIPVDTFLKINESTSKIIANSNIGTVLDKRTGGNNTINQALNDNDNIDKKTMSIFLALYKNAAEKNMLDELNKELWSLGAKFV